PVGPDDLLVHLRGDLSLGGDLSDLVDLRAHIPSFLQSPPPWPRQCSGRTWWALGQPNDRPSYRGVATRSLAAGHADRRGHHERYGPAVSRSSRPSASSAAALATRTTRSAAWTRVSSETSSACHSPEDRNTVATRMGGTPNRSVYSRAYSRMSSGCSGQAPPLFRSRSSRVDREGSGRFSTRSTHPDTTTAPPRN